jgi:hypothetical protein
VGGGIAVAQGGDFWKGALGGAISGAFGGLGWGVFGSSGNFLGIALCAAAGGALGALVTGGDPGMAAATAAISSVVSFGLFSEGGIFGSFSGSITEQHIKLLMASTGVGALTGGVSAEIFGGDFGEGAMWGAASAAATAMLSYALSPSGDESQTEMEPLDLDALTIEAIEYAMTEDQILVASTGGDPLNAEDSMARVSLEFSDEYAMYKPKPPKTKTSWFRRLFGRKSTSNAFKTAKAKFPKQLEQAQRLTSKQLKKSISSYSKQIARHKNYLRNPSSHVKNWKSLPLRHQRNLIYHWKQDIMRHEAYKKIAEGVLKTR